MSEPTPRFRWGWPAASRVCALVAFVLFVLLACGGHLGSLPLLPWGLAFLALAFVL